MLFQENIALSQGSERKKRRKDRKKKKEREKRGKRFLTEQSFGLLKDQQQKHI